MCEYQEIAVSCLMHWYIISLVIYDNNFSLFSIHTRHELSIRSTKVAIAVKIISLTFLQETLICNRRYIDKQVPMYSILQLHSLTLYYAFKQPFWKSGIILDLRYGMHSIRIIYTFEYHVVKLHIRAYFIISGASIMGTNGGIQCR